MAPRVEHAPRRLVDRARQVTGQHDALAGFELGIDHRNRRDQRFRVRVPGRGIHVGRRPHLDQLTQIHHADAVGDVVHHREVVGDKDVGERVLSLQIGQQVQHLGLNRYVERRHGLVGNQ